MHIFVCYVVHIYQKLSLTLPLKANNLIVGVKIPITFTPTVANNLVRHFELYEPAIHLSFQACPQSLLSHFPNACPKIVCQTFLQARVNLECFDENSRPLDIIILKPLMLIVSTFLFGSWVVDNINCAIWKLIKSFIFSFSFTFIDFPLFNVKHSSSK